MTTPRNPLPTLRSFTSRGSGELDSGSGVSSLDQAMEKTLEDLVLVWLDSRGIPPKTPGEKFLSLKDILLEAIALACQSPTTEADDRLQNYKDKAEYRGLAHTLRVTPTGAVRSYTQERLIQILERLGGNN